MTHPYYHAESSARIFGGVANDYIEYHNFLDRHKEHFCDFRHRLLTHHAEGIFEAERKFGFTISISNGKEVPLRYVLEQHVKEDCGGRVPNLSDWLKHINPQPWMARSYKLSERGARSDY